MKNKNPRLAAAIEAAKEAGEYILKNSAKFGKIFYKGRINLVTKVDRKSEEIVVSGLNKAFKGYGILAEERGLEKDAPKKWIIDPLDGTTNFAHNIGIYAVSIGLEEAGRITAGVVYDPSRRELFTAERNDGAYLNNKPIRVSKISALARSLLVTGFAYNVKEAEFTNIENFRKFLLASQGVRRTGSAAIDLCYVACGRFDGFWEVGLNPWDTAAGSLIAQEAGARLTSFSGGPYSHYDKQILVTNGKIHAQMLRVFKK